MTLIEDFFLLSIDEESGTIDKKIKKAAKVLIPISIIAELYLAKKVSFFIKKIAGPFQFYGGFPD